MSAKETMNRIGECGAVLVVRCESAEEAVEGIRAVVEGGLKAVEVTFTVPGAPSVIRKVARAFGDQVLLGAGTVTEPRQAEEAIDAGATYLVAPNTDPKVIGAAKRLGVPILPGGFTPTEVLNAWNLGADAVKIFPASLGGPSYLKALKAPLPHVPMVPTGGVDAKTVGEFFAAGAFAVGAGGSLFDLKLLRAKEFGKMTEIAKSFVAAMNAARNG